VKWIADNETLQFPVQHVTANATYGDPDYSKRHRRRIRVPTESVGEAETKLSVGDRLNGSWSHDHAIM